MKTEQKRIVNVPVATVWTDRTSPRAMDKPATSHPVELNEWLDEMDYNARLELCNADLVQTQVLYGQEVIVIDEKEEWVEVLIPEQPSAKNSKGYPGWIPLSQVVVNEGWNIQEGPVAVITAKKSTLYTDTNEALFELSYQTILPIISENDGTITVKTPDGKAFLERKDVTIYPTYRERKKGNGKEIVAAGEQFLGLPYLWGGISSFGFDCSGFSYSVCRANGFTIPRDGGDQSTSGKRIPLHEIMPGDLLFFAYEEGKGSIHHVGIYYGDGRLLHSPSTGRVIEITSLAGTIYEQELCAASRYWQETED